MRMIKIERYPLSHGNVYERGKGERRKGGSGGYRMPFIHPRRKKGRKGERERPLLAHPEAQAKSS